MTQLRAMGLVVLANMIANFVFVSLLLIELDRAVFYTIGLTMMWFMAWLFK